MFQLKFSDVISLYQRIATFMYNQATHSYCYTEVRCNEVTSISEFSVSELCTEVVNEI